MNATSQYAGMLLLSVHGRTAAKIRRNSSPIHSDVGQQALESAALSTMNTYTSEPVQSSPAFRLARAAPSLQPLVQGIEYTGTAAMHYRCSQHDYSS